MLKSEQFQKQRDSTQFSHDSTPFKYSPLVHTHLEGCESFCFIVNSLACTFSRRLVTFAVVPSALPPRGDHETNRTTSVCNKIYDTTYARQLIAREYEPGGRYISKDGLDLGVATLLPFCGTASLI